MVYQPITYARFTDNTMLRVVNMKSVVWAVSVSFASQIIMQSKHIILKEAFKLLHISFATLPPPELVPAVKKICRAYYFSITFMPLSHTVKQQEEIPIVQKLYDLYKTFYSYSLLFPKKDKYTLGAKCERYILSTLELLLAASSTPQTEKLVLLRQANVKFDALKILLRLAREICAIDAKKYVTLQTQIQEIGRMLGGWQRSLNNIQQPIRELA